ncbi:N-acetylmuramoyl-L-alanine amidase [PVC group bacterium]|nr:N-acetylmuramoyl-L-alanine amidase [PVC group bacterium]
MSHKTYSFVSRLGTAETFAKNENLTYMFDSSTGLVRFESGDIMIRALVGFEDIIINGRLYSMDEAFGMSDGKVRVPSDFLALYRKITKKRKRKFRRDVSEKRVIVKKAVGLKKIVLDPGHGDHNFGAVGRRGTKEKNVVLDIALHLKKLLKSQGKELVMTRNRDVFVKLSERARIANKFQTDFFVSIHANASKNRGANGVEVYYLSQKTDDYSRAVTAMENQSFDLKQEEKEGLLASSKGTEQIVKELKFTEFRKESIDMAASIQKELARVVKTKNRGVKSANFYVLRKVNSPSVLVEVGFLTNPGEERKLATKSYRKIVAQAIYRGIMNYDRIYERSEGFTK